MFFEDGLAILRMLSIRPGTALSAKQIRDKWPNPPKEQGKDGQVKRVLPSIRTVYRYLNTLVSARAGGSSLVEQTTRDGQQVYFLKPTPEDTWFLTEEMALDLSLGGQVLEGIFGANQETSEKSWAERAEEFLSQASDGTRRIRAKLRIVPDGIGRLPARIEPEVLRQTITAIRKDKKVRFVYTNAKGDKKSKVLTPLGLVAKDGTIYLVAVDGATGRPIHYALHRMSEASVHDDMSQPRHDFDLDRYIWDTHQFSHVLSGSDQLVSLELRVAPETIYHFRERPLSEDQRVTEPMAADGWYRVDAKVPHTILLVPFLLSMGHWIEVLGPKEVRDETALRARQMWQHYQKG